MLHGRLCVGAVAACVFALCAEGIAGRVTRGSGLPASARPLLSAAGVLERWTAGVLERWFVVGVSATAGSAEVGTVITACAGAAVWAAGSAEQLIASAQIHVPLSRLGLVVFRARVGIAFVFS